MKSFNKTELLLIFLPGLIFILAVILTTDIIFPHKVDLYFVYTDGKIGGSRWFSYKYMSDKYFRENTSSPLNKYISTNNVLQQVPGISKSRGYSDEEIKLLYHIIDSCFIISNRSIDSEKAIDIIELNIALDEINR
jgi:K+-transporting ATPase c subunit